MDCMWFSVSHEMKAEAMEAFLSLILRGDANHRGCTGKQPDLSTG